MQQLRWARPVLVIAGIYNISWGLFMGMFPRIFFSVIDMQYPAYPWLWQCIGMFVGTFGVGYLLAALRPRRHWPMVFVGLLGKILGPAGFFITWLRGNIPLNFGITIIFNDLIWWIPFILILKHSSMRDELKMIFN